jgi:hypothetical protein
MLLVAVAGHARDDRINESLRVNLVLVAIKLFVVLFVIVAGLFYVKGSHLRRRSSRRRCRPRDRRRHAITTPAVPVRVRHHPVTDCSA